MRLLTAIFEKQVKKLKRKMGQKRVLLGRLIYALYSQCRKYVDDSKSTEFIPSLIAIKKAECLNSIFDLHCPLYITDKICLLRSHLRSHLLLSLIEANLSSSLLSPPQSFVP